MLPHRLHDKQPDGLPKHIKIGFCCYWLVKEGEVFATPNPRLETRIKDLTKSKRSIVEGEATSCTVITIEIALAITNA